LLLFFRPFHGDILVEHQVEQPLAFFSRFTDDENMMNCVIIADQTETNGAESNVVICHCGIRTQHRSIAIMSLMADDLIL
jgi:hypothetical protein